MKKVLFRILAIFFAMMSFGGILETHEIMTSDAPDIAPARTYLMVIALLSLALFLFLTRFFWLKARR